MNICAAYSLTLFLGRNCRLRSCTVRCLLGRDPILWHLPASAVVQLAEAGRDLVLQHEPYPSRVVKSLGYSWGTFQPSLLSQQSSCCLLCPRCSSSACYEVLREGRVGSFQVPKGLPQTIRVYDDTQLEPRSSRHGMCNT